MAALIPIVTGRLHRRGGAQHCPISGPMRPIARLPSKRYSSSPHGAVRRLGDASFLRSDRGLICRASGGIRAAVGARAGRDHAIEDEHSDMAREDRISRTQDAKERHDGLRADILAAL